MHNIKTMRTASATSAKSAGINTLFVGSLMLLSSLSVDAATILPLDTNPPNCSLSRSGGEVPVIISPDGAIINSFPTVFAFAEDSRPSEDANANGILDPGEDLNGNGLIDVDTGIYSIVLEAGAVNLAITVNTFIPGDPYVYYLLEVIDTALPGVGEVVVTDGAGNVCREKAHVGAFDPFAGIVRTPTRNLQLTLRRPSPTTAAVRCVESVNVIAPNFGQLPFIPFTSDPLLTNFTLSGGDGVKRVCCQFQDNALVISPAMCGSIELAEGLPAPVQDLYARAKPGKVDLVWTPPASAINFHMMRADVSGGPYVCIGFSDIGVFVDWNATPGQTYYYVVDSVGSLGKSGHSNEVQITVPTRASRIQ